MAKFYSNENFAIDIVKILRQSGYGVLTSYEARQADQRLNKLFWQRVVMLLLSKMFVSMKKFSLLVIIPR